MGNKDDKRQTKLILSLSHSFLIEGEKHIKNLFVKISVKLLKNFFLLVKFKIRLIAKVRVID